MDKNSSKTSNPQGFFSKKEAINFGFEVAKKNIVFFLGVFIIWIIITASSSIIQNSLNYNRQFLMGFLFSLLTWLIGSAFSLGVTNVTLMFIDKKKPELKDLYYTNKLFNFIIASIIRTLIVIGGFILLIIPGIIFAIKLQFAEYLIVDKKMDAVDSVKASWEITKGAKWNLFLFGLLLGLINILGFICLILGLFITVPLSMVATAFVYRKLLSQTNLK